MTRDPFLKDAQLPPVRVRREELLLTERAAHRAQVRLSEYIRDVVRLAVRRDLGLDEERAA